ncbi:hypothetical protein ABPG75_006535 [Micractinium tetrahymenae]
MVAIAQLQQRSSALRAGSRSSARSRAARLVPAAGPPSRQFRTIREDIDKKRLEKQLGSQGAAKPPPRPAAAEEPAGPNMAVGAAIAVLLPILGFWLLSR